MGQTGSGSSGQYQDRDPDQAVLVAYGAAALSLGSTRIFSGLDDRVVPGVRNLPDHPD